MDPFPGSACPVYPDLHDPVCILKLYQRGIVPKRGIKKRKKRKKTKKDPMKRLS